MWTSQERINVNYAHALSISYANPTVTAKCVYTSYTSSQPYSSSTWHFVLSTLNYFNWFKIILFMHYNFNNTFTWWGERKVYIFVYSCALQKSPTLHNRNEGKTWDRFLYEAFRQYSLIIKSSQHTKTHHLTNARFTTQLVQYVLAFLTSVTELLDIYGQLHYLAGRTHILSQHSSFQRMTQCPTYLSECVCRWQFGLIAVPLTARHTPNGNKH